MLWNNTKGTRCTKSKWPTFDFWGNNCWACIELKVYQYNCLLSSSSFVLLAECWGCEIKAGLSGFCPKGYRLPSFKPSQEATIKMRNIMRKKYFVYDNFATLFWQCDVLKVVYFLALCKLGLFQAPGPPPLLPLTFLTDRSLSVPCWAAEETFFNVDSTRLCLSTFVPWPSLYICDLNLLPAVQTYS